jgi:hypothetical protein
MIYTEKGTRLLYTVKFIMDFAIVKPASPGFETELRKLSIIDFEREFEEFSGDHSAVERYLDGDEDLPETLL